MKGSIGSCRKGAIVLGVIVSLLASAAFAEVINLTNGVPVVGISGAVGSQQFYTIVVPEGQDDLVICISGGAGDCDLYVRRDADPTTTAYDYRPYKIGNEESVTVASPQAGTWHVMLRGFTDYSDLTLKATCTCAAVAIPLTNGVAMAGLSGAPDTEQFYQIAVLANRSRLQIGISGGTGDCDLYVRKDALPTTDVYDYRPFLLGNSESVVINDPAAGTWYIMLRGYRDYANVTLAASSFGVAVGGPAHSAVTIAGNGGLVMAGGGGWRPYIYPPDTSIATGLWPDVVAEDPAGGGSTLVSGSHKMQWMLDYAPSSESATTITASFTVSPSLFAGNSGDSASANCVVKLELLSWIGTLIDSDEVHPASMTVANGADFNEPVTVSVSVVTPNHMVDGRNNSTLRLTAYAAAEAFTCIPDEQSDRGVITLTNGVPVGGLAGAAASEAYYRIEVPSGQSGLEISTAGGTGDVDLYVHRNAKPTTTDWDYRPYLIGSDETVAINNPKPGTYYILLKGSESYSGTTLRAFFGDTKQQTR